MAKQKSGVESLILKKDSGKADIVIDFIKLKNVALTLRAINHPLQKTMLRMLEQKRELIVSDIYANLKIEQSVASQHLAILRRSGVVSTKRVGKFIYYSVSKKRFAQVVDFVENLVGPE